MTYVRLDVDSVRIWEEFDKDGLGAHELVEPFAEDHQLVALLDHLGAVGVGIGLAFLVAGLVGFAPSQLPGVDGLVQLLELGVEPVRRPKEACSHAGMWPVLFPLLTICVPEWAMSIIAEMLLQSRSDG